MTRYHQHGRSEVVATRRRQIQRQRVKDLLVPTAIYGTMALVAAFMFGSAFGARAAALANGIAADGAKVVATVHGEGAQIYQCRANNAGELRWQFREPVATLISNDKTVRRHFAGPSWELADGSRIEGKVAAQAPGATEKDIPVLRLDVVAHAGDGILSKVDTVQRLNTRGGVFAGACQSAGSLYAEPYSADYVFLSH
ncbi:DUF3455 domain-containing protein [Rhizobium sp. BK376]|uniref:DUF3455 domain-containing protein n=1 Tax=Rhizobium sp. BK376 TaxID=2512149 RepID=UPI0010EFE91E|nr:DUF3455 domain-containing protein [Rhizobium sp. BK376]TCR72776.1 uncharacterized protein DUF3455 [Rhizobium sp. BK376]